jgi:tellurite resistance protein TerC
MTTPLWAWAAVSAAIVAMLLVDLLGLRSNGPHVVSVREAAVSSAVWVAIGLGFGVLLWLVQGGDRAGQYFAGYLVEKSLSVDNIVVFALLFSYFAVPAALQRTVLLWGVVGALVLRLVFVIAGAALLDRFAWMVYLFGAFLVVTGVRMARGTENHSDPSRNPALRLLGRVVPVTGEYRGTRFLVREAGRRVATPLLAVLVVVETTDVLFAVDSIPAVFAVTRDPFLVFTSNAFAILGLRALYFLLGDLVGRFRYLTLGLSVVLVLVGLKMIGSHWWHAPTWLSLTAIAAVIGASVVASLRVADSPA